MTDKHQALRDAISDAFYHGQHYSRLVESRSVRDNRESYEVKGKFEAERDAAVNALLADHDRMREALQGLLNLLPNVNTLSIKAAREELQEDEQ